MNFDNLIEQYGTSIVYKNKIGVGIYGFETDIKAVLNIASADAKYVKQGLIQVGDFIAHFKTSQVVSVGDRITYDGVDWEIMSVEKITYMGATAYYMAAMIRTIDPIVQYGVTWDESADAYARTGTLHGTAVGSSPGNAVLPIQAAMKRCILNDAGVVQYYLDPADSTKKADGSPANIDGTDGQVMVEIPAFYYRYLYDGSVHLWEISPVAKAGFTLHPAFVKNGVNVSARYIGAYEGVMYDVSASRYTNGVYDPVFDQTTFTAATKTITQPNRTNPYTPLQVGDKIKVSGTANNNGTFTVATTGDQSITVEEDLVDETASAIVETEKDWTATTGDKLASVSGKAPINYGTRANFRAAAKNRGAGWRQQDYDLILAIQLLYLVEYASFNSQSAIGKGLTDWGGASWLNYNRHNPINYTGISNSDGNGTNNVDNGAGVVGSYMSYRGIENWYGHILKWVDGININDRVPYVSNNDSTFADNTATGYIALGIALPPSNGWQSTLHKISRGFLPAAVGASATTKITDYFYGGSGWRVGLHGGWASDTTLAGAFFWQLAYLSSDLERQTGGRLAY